MATAFVSRSRYVWLAAVALVALAGGLATAVLVRESAPAPVEAATLLAVSLPDLEGREQSLGQWRGKLIVVNFWATWCAPCREEMPLFVKAQADHGAQGLQFVGIAVDEPAKVRQFAGEIGLNYPTLIGGYGAMELSKTLGNKIMALPFTVVVDRSGKVVLRHLGPMKPPQLDKILKQGL